MACGTSIKSIWWTQNLNSQPACQNTSSFHPLDCNQGLQVLHCRPWMVGSEIENTHGDVWLQYHGNVWFFCVNDHVFTSGQCLVVSQLHHGCIAHWMLYNWVSIFLDSLQLDLSMLTLKFLNWRSNGWKNSQYNTAGACLKWFYAAHEVLKLILCIGASFISFQVLLGTLAIPKYAKVLLCSVCFFTVLLDRFATASSPNWLGQYFCAFPAACSILTLKLVVKAMKTWPIQDGRRLTEHSKNYDSAGDWLWSQSQHLISLFLCFLGVGAEAFWVSIR